MLEFFANSLIDGFLNSNAMGRGLVLVQLGGSTVMVACIISKLRELKQLLVIGKRVRRDVMGSRSILDNYLARTNIGDAPVETIYRSVCERLLKQLTPDVRNLLMGRQTTPVATVSNFEMALVRSIADQKLEEASLAIEKGMPWIATIVALAPMVGLLGTVWGVLDAFADMGAAGSATIATMAPAISAALVTTVVGLLIAIPGMAMHNILSGMLREIVAGMEGFTDDLLGRIALEFQGTEAGVA